MLLIIPVIFPENMPGVVDVRFVEREPADKRSLLSWEQVKYERLGHCNLVCLYTFIK